jgi:F0F1-type ATP synthase assembly protein I
MSPPAGEGPGGAELLGLGGTIAGAVIVPLVLGLAADRALGTGPVFLVIGLTVGIAAACLAVYVRFRRYL